MEAQAPNKPRNPKALRAPGLTVTPMQAAELMGVHRATLYRWLERGLFPQPTMKAGRTVRWSRELVEKFAREGLLA